MVDELTASERFLKGIEKIARAIRMPGAKAAREPQLQAAEAIRREIAEHEERKKRISDAIRNGARISRNH
jgi:hypothetical protein